MNFEEFKKYVDETLESIYSKLNEEEKTFISDLVTKFNQKCEENEDFKKDKESLNKCGFANVIQLLLAYAGLQEENQSLKEQQKEFIKYLEDKITQQSRGSWEHILKRGLLTYKEIIGLSKGDKE